MYAQRAAAEAEASGLAWQIVCTTPSYNSAKARPVCPGHANARSWRRPAKPCDGRLAGFRCNIDDTAACFCGLWLQHVDAGALCPVSLFFLLDSTSSGQRKKYKWSCFGPCGDIRTPHPIQASTTTRLGGVDGQPSHDYRSAQSTDAAASIWYLACIFFAADSSGQRKQWSCFGPCGDARTQHSTPNASIEQRAPVASLDRLRMIAVDHRAHTRSSSSSYLVPDLTRSVFFFSSRISHRSRWFLLVLFKILEI